MFLPRLASALVPTSILLPLYVYPVTYNSTTNTNTDQWAPLKTAIAEHKGIQFDLIINPASGPDQPPKPSAFDTTYVQSIANLRIYNNTKLFVYVRTNYAKTEASKVNSDISRYAAANISFDGIFFDETSSATSSLKYYSDASTFARQNGFQTVILNPGAIVDKGFYDFADIIVAQEEYAAKLNVTDLTVKLDEQYRRKSAVLLHDFTGSPADQDKIVNDIHNADFGYLTVTTAKKQGDQEWNTISEVWPDLVNSVNIANGPLQDAVSQ